MKIVTIVPLQRGVFRGDLTYFTSLDVPLGSVVVAPVRSKKILGLVVSAQSASGAKMDIKEMNFDLKKIIEIKKTSIFLPQYLTSAFETTDYFVAHGRDSMASFIPSIFREKYDEIQKFAVPKINPREDVNPQMTSATDKQPQGEKLLLQSNINDRIVMYKTLIRGSFASGRSVFVVLPTEHDIRVFYGALSKGIEQFSFTFHSEHGVKKLMANLKGAMSTSHPVLILGTAPYLSIPRLDLGTIILEHESSSNYRTMSGTPMDMRLFTEVFATKIKARLIIGDTLLSYATIAREKMQTIATLHPPSFRVSFEGKMSVVKPRQGNKASTAQTKSPSTAFRIFPPPAIEQIKQTLAKGKSILVFALRKGLATQTVCRDCGQIVICDDCSVPVVLYYSEDHKKRMFVCNKCQKSTVSEKLCVACQSWNLVPLGIGTDTVMDELKGLLPKTNILKLDKEIAKSGAAAKKIIERFEKKSGSILVGTEMALNYLGSTDGKVSLSIIASFDSLWCIPSFEMSERILQLVTAILERTKDESVIITKNDTDPAISALMSKNLWPFIETEIEDRKKLHYPPFKRFIKITHHGSKEDSKNAKQSLMQIFEKYKPEVFSGFLAREKGKYVTNALIRVDPASWSLSALSPGSHLDEDLKGRLASLGPEFNVSVDPEDLL